MGLSKLAKGWRKGAIKGNAEDQYQLAVCHYKGTEGAKLDKVAAAAWYGKAAEQEHAGAQCYLGICYGFVDGLEQNLEVAAQWYLRAAELGNAEAQGWLGGCYALGKGVEQDDAQAVACWEKGAVQEDAGSQHNLGLCNMHGRHGLPKNAVRARSFLKAAAAQGRAVQVHSMRGRRFRMYKEAPSFRPAPRACLQ